MNVTPLQRLAAQELLKQEEALDSLSKFREYMEATASIDFQHPPARHHQLIIRELERLERGEIRRLMILAPPGSAKSTYCSIQYPLWHLARAPQENILCASNSQELAENFNRRRRNLALTPQWMALSQTKLAEDLQGAGHFGTQRQGGVRAAGVGSSIVGFRSHLNVLDDPIRGHEEALSSSALDKQWDWFHSEFRTRLVPSGRELIVSTRWAKKDIAGRLLATEGDTWTVLRLPMLADSADDPLGRAIGEPLWPEWFPSGRIAELQRSPLLWATQFQQTPLDDSGAWIGNEHIVYEDSAPERLTYVIGVDLALTVGRGDYTALVVAGLDEQRKLHVVHVERARVSPDETVARLHALNAQYEPADVLIDDDNASKVFTRLLYELSRTKHGRPIPLRPQPIRGKDKETRAASLRGFFLNDSVRIVRAPWNAALHAELLSFPSGEHDDQVDALSLIGRRFPLLSAPVTDVPESGFKTRTFVGDDGRMYLNGNLDEMFADRDDRIRLARRSWR